MLFEKMSTRIELQTIRQVAKAESGELVDEVVSRSSMWAEIRQPRNGNVKSSVANSEIGLGLQSFVIRYRDGIDMRKHRIKDKAGELWNIIDIPKIINRKQGLELVCQATGKTEIEGKSGIIDMVSLMLGGVAGE